MPGLQTAEETRLLPSWNLESRGRRQSVSKCIKQLKIMTISHKERDYFREALGRFLNRVMLTSKVMDDSQRN